MFSDSDSSTLSIFNKVLGVYTRDGSRLTSFKGKCGRFISSRWNQVFQPFLPIDDASMSSNSPMNSNVDIWKLQRGGAMAMFGVQEATVPISLRDVEDLMSIPALAEYFKGQQQQTHTLQVCEINLASERQIRGLIVVGGPLSDFEKWFLSQYLINSKNSHSEAAEARNLDVLANDMQSLNLFGIQSQNQ